MTSRLFVNVVIAGLLCAIGNSGCQRSPSSPSILTSPPSSNSSQPLTVSAVSPGVGVIGDTVKVSGTGFAQGSTVMLGEELARVTSISSGVLLAIAPPHPPGEVDVTVTNRDGDRATLPHGYAYDLVTLKASTDTIAAGSETLTVSWIAPPGRPLLDWIALIKVGESTVTTYEKGWWDYTKGIAAGAMTLRAPGEPGRYEFRYMIDDGFVEAAKSGAVIVRPSAFPSIRGGRAREK
jgi:Ca-activated chloride channel homolog